MSIIDEVGAQRSQVLQINVSPVNDLPSYEGDTAFSSEEENPLTIAMSYTDIDSHQVVFDIQSLPDGWQGGTNCATATLVPKENDFGQFEVMVAMVDGNDSVEQVLGIELFGINHALTAPSASLSGTVTAGQSLMRELGITDPDFEALVYGVTVKPSRGAVSVPPDGKVTYKANIGSIGTDSSTIEASDSSGEKVSVAMSVTISAAKPASGPSSKGGSRAAVTTVFDGAGGLAS